MEPPGHRPAFSLPAFKLEPYRIVAGLILLGCAVFVFFIYRSFLWSAFLAMVLYISFGGIHRRILQRLKGRKTAAATLSTMLSVGLILAPLGFMAQQLIMELLNLYETTRQALVGERLFQTIQNFPALIQFLTRSPTFWVDYYRLLEFIYSEYINYMDIDQLSSWLGGATSLLMGGLSFALLATGNLFFTLLLLFFLFKDAEHFQLYLRKMLPLPEHYIRDFADRSKTILVAVLKGNLLISLLQGAALGIGFLIAGIPNPLAYAFIATILSLIPVVGTALVWLPACFYLSFFQNAYWTAFVLGAYCLLAYLALENVLKPKILDRKLGIHPLFLFLAILGGLKEFGMGGLIIGPLMVTLFISLWSTLINERKKPPVHSAHQPDHQGHSGTEQTPAQRVD